MKILTVDYGTHTYKYNIHKQDLFCPICGEKDVWREEGEGDYYQGGSYYCLSCSSRHYLDSSITLESRFDEPILTAIKKVK